MSSLLRFEGVTCRRGGRILFEDLDLELRQGEALHLSGPNGSGKSSLLRLAAGLLHAENGGVHRGSVALADEHLALDRELPLARALSFWSGQVDEAIDAMGLRRLEAVPVRLLSTGQAMRATLARVAASDAALWLLDEPLNGLDADGVERLDALVAAHLERGGAVLAASHGPLGGTWSRMELSA
ncbi:heme ABC exporter ATP-binding protein CcmA [Sphingomonas sp. SM33]|uniref:Heme ABC exporter ATP-binding protein CcmA n=1 Tax=Sphingomonas telluris TaxID=2907998 RepID=A0ABS9VQE0_9SPHN|nr:heme ABC exporter ATP-binding protein CcmA [Sphingomonas telluris]